jgi:hypothetical protein
MITRIGVIIVIQNVIVHREVSISGLQDQRLKQLAL